jgi:predicted O-methyltransferase YrrM
MKLKEMLAERRKEILNYLYQKCQGTVQHGIFKGMRILKKNQWGDGDTGGKLLGLYEDELVPVLEKAIETKHDLIINYGCAEGFYGIGMAMKMPESHVIMFDIEQKSLDIAKENADLNNVKNVEFSNNCNNLEYFESLLSAAKNPFLIMDCEGYESYMLNLEKVPSLAKVTAIVEMHDCLYKGLTDNLIYQFNNSHNLEGITQGTKNYHIDPITELSDTDKFIINNENRPCTMHWIYMVPIKDETQNVAE